MSPRRQELRVPPEIQTIIDQPGRSWRTSARDRMRNWLMQEPQFRILLSKTQLTGLYSAGEVEDDLERWFRTSFHAAIDAYDPSTCARFWSYQAGSAQGHLLDAIGRDLDPYQVPEHLQNLFARPGNTWTAADLGHVQEWLHCEPQRSRMLAKLSYASVLNAKNATATDREDILHLWFERRYARVTEGYNPQMGTYWRYRRRHASGYLLTCLANPRHPDELNGLVATVRGREIENLQPAEIDANWEQPDEHQFDVPDSSSPANPTIAAEQRNLGRQFAELLPEAIASLRNEKHRIVFIEVEITARDMREVAEDYGWTYADVRQCRSRAQQKVHQWFQDNHPDLADALSRLTSEF